jgi:dihydropteroate synthase
LPEGEAVQRNRFRARMLRVEGEADARRILDGLGTDNAGAVIMSSKMVHAAIAVEGVQARAANVIKQVMLSKGGECATPRDTLLKSEEPVSVIIIGTQRQLRQAIKNLSVQPFGLRALSRELKALMDDSFGREPSARRVNAGNFILELGGRTLVMGIVNVTPDSFSDGGEFFDFDTAREHALSMTAAGADIIDIGGESTRPGAEPLSQEEEERRTIPLIESLVGELEVPISIDTYKSAVAEKALDAGAAIVNDISALRLDEELGTLVADRGVPIILMHMQGMPRNMQENPVYDDVVADISRFLLERAGYAEEQGIDPASVMIDPGIGFGKTVGHNLEIVRRLEEFRSLGYPLVLGTSRKRFIGSVTGCEVTERMMGTAATVAFAIARGVDIVRVHDVPEMVEVVKMADAVSGKSGEFE